MIKMKRLLLTLGIVCLSGVFVPTSFAAPNQTRTVVVAIDAGHGGKDPGAIGPKGLQEKTVNFGVAQKLHKLLQGDSRFKPVLTRTGDYFISVYERSNIARDNNADFLISVHADAAQNSRASGASVWVLSNKRADTELGRWLEQQDKQSELLGGGGNALANNNDNPYLSQAVIDLQFAHSRKVGYDVAMEVLGELTRVNRLHKKLPEHVSLGVLRSPDIPSILIEVGFISNRDEEQLLKTQQHQEKIALAIYQGIDRYYRENPLYVKQNVKVATAPVTQVKPRVEQTTPTVNVFTGTTTERSTTDVHVVKNNETLFSIAKRYGLTLNQLKALNNMQNNTIIVGQKLKVSGQGKVSTPPSPTSVKKTPTKAATPVVKKYRVVAGDSLSTIAERHKVKQSELRRQNNLKNDTVRVGQVLIIPN